MASFCAYQERTQQEVRDKLYNLDLHRDEVEEILAELITEDFVNEERFSRTFARGKFDYNKWGRLKIKQALQLKGLSSFCQNVGLSEIGDSEYLSRVEHLLEKKLNSLKEEDTWVKKNKAARYLIGKGYESELVWNILNDLIS